MLLLQSLLFSALVMNKKLIPTTAGKLLLCEKNFGLVSNICECLFSQTVSITHVVLKHCYLVARGLRTTFELRILWPRIFALFVIFRGGLDTAFILFINWV